MRHAPTSLRIVVLLSAAAFLSACGGRAATSLLPDPGTASDPAGAAPAIRLEEGRSAGGPSAGPVPPAPGEAPGTGPAAPGGRGVYHALQPGQTLYSMARVYGVPLETLIRVNRIADPSRIPDGTPILIPGARRTLDVAPTFTPASDPGLTAASVLPLPGVPLPVTPPAPEGAAPRRGAPQLPALSWPIRGAVTSHFGRRGRHAHHDGVDIDGVAGEEILAAAGGTIVRAGRERHYGRLVVIDHGGGLTTLYAHASRLLVHEGDRVERGDPIAEVGHSGNARGTHLHFEIRRGGRPLDPLPILRAGEGSAADAG